MKSAGGYAAARSAGPYSGLFINIILYINHFLPFIYQRSITNGIQQSINLTSIVFIGHND